MRDAHLFQVFEPELGMPVAALFNDNVWYRGEIVDILPERLECAVMFVDYGNLLCLELTKLRYLRPEYLDHYVPTMKCCLFGVNITDEINLKNVYIFLFC